MKKSSRFFLSILFIASALSIWQTSAGAKGLEQIPTVDIATVTGTPPGAMVTVKLDIDQPYINVRSGPNSTYDKIGLLYAGQSAPALGWSEGKRYIMIQYPGSPDGTGWVFAPYVNLSSGATLPLIEMPLEPTPAVTRTIDPTLAAQYLSTPNPTRLPTFTPPPPISIPTFEWGGGAGGYGGVPTGLVIIILMAIGLFLGIFTFVQSR